MRSRRQVKWAQLRVACISAVALLILGVLLYLLTGGTMFKEKATLFLYIPDATGLIEGSPVRVNGILVGKVSHIALSGSKDPKRVVRLSLQVERDSLSMIPVGSYSELGTESPVGDQFVDITSRGREPMPPRSELPFHEPTDFSKTLNLVQFEARLRDMDAVLTDIEAGKGRVGQFVKGNQMYTDLRRRLGDIEKSVHDAASTTTAFGQELYSDRLYRQLMTPLTEFDQSLARLQSGQGAAGRLLQDPAQYEQAAATVRNLRDSIATLRTSRFVQSDALYNDLNRMVGSLTQSVDQLNAGALFGAPQSYESLNGFARDLEKTVHDFREDPRKYLRLDIF